MVEAAIVLPMYVFLLLGILQLGLMHQARLMTKYAAYKAARAGALWNADPGQMDTAALGVLLPLLSTKTSSGVESIKPVSDASSFIQKWMWPSRLMNRIPEWPTLRIVETTICGPLKGDVPAKPEIDFDDPREASGSGWQDSQRTKLRVQVTFHYRMPIPFANMIIHGIAYYRELPTVVRMDAGARPGIISGMNQYSMAAQRGVYIVPIRANYVMRMQSNLFTQHLPETNKCRVPFKKKS